MAKPIGELIKEELVNQHHTVTWFAHELNCHRVNAYDIFKRENMDLALLIQISKILHKNFLRILADQIEDECIIDGK